jgi:hypothetical protein
MHKNKEQGAKECTTPIQKKECNSSIVSSFSNLSLTNYKYKSIHVYDIK